MDEVDTRLHFRILGPLQVVTADGDVVAIAGARERALLTRLLVEPGRPVSDTRLLDDLWADIADSARKSLQVRVSMLRRQLADVAEIDRVGNGYQLAVDPMAVDATRFERALDEAAGLAPSDAVGVLEQALSWWRPPVLVDLRDTPAADMRVRWERMARDARRRLGSALVDSGQAGRGVLVLADLADEAPDDEAVATDLVRGLYADGRAAEALVVHRATVEALASSGLDPAPAFRELATHVLQHDPGLAGTSVPAQSGRDATASPPATTSSSSAPGVGGSLAPVEPLPPHASLQLVAMPFLGRRQAVAAAVHALVEDRVRLLTLWGPGGVGKTRLALEVARRVEPAFPEPHIVVDGARIHDPDDLPAALVRAAGLPERGRPLEVLAAGLGVRQVLVLVDNFEHLMDATDVLTRLVSAGEGIQVLVTSRVVLNLRHERVQPVDPLGAQAVAGEVTAVDFLRRRASDMGATDVDDDATLRRIAERLDGLPLALELAAARLRGMPASRLEADLDQRLGALGVLHDLPDRQRTLEATVAWSASLLDEGPRNLLLALGVFAAPAGRDAIAAVLPGSDRDDLTVLVDHALVRRVATGDGHEAFVLLETVRTWAARELAAAPWGESARRRHADHHSAEAALAAEALETSAQSTAMRRLAAVEADMERALRTLQDTGQEHVLCRMTLDLWRWWWGVGATRTARRWLQVGATTACDCPDLARVWSHLAFVRATLGDADGARSALAAAERVPMGGSIPPAVDVARWVVAFQDQEVGAALRAADRAAAAFQDQGRAVLAAEMGVRKALVVAAAGDLDEAERLNRTALAVMVAHGPRWEQASVHNNLAHLALERGDTSTALAESAASLATFDQLPFVRDRWIARETLMSIHAARGDLDDARQAGRLALREARRVGDVEAVQRVRIALADVELDDARPDVAAATLLEGAIVEVHPAVAWHLLAVCARLLAMVGDHAGAVDAASLAARSAPDPLLPQRERLAVVVHDLVTSTTSPDVALTGSDLASVAARVALVVADVR